MNSIKDWNYVAVNMGVSSADNTLPLPFKVNPVTGRLLIDVVGTGNMTWPVSSTDNAIPRFDWVSWDTLQDSWWVIADDNSLTASQTTTSSNAIRFNLSSLTNGKWLYIIANSLTTWNAIELSSTGRNILSTSTGTKNVTLTNTISSSSDLVVLQLNAVNSGSWEPIALEVSNWDVVIEDWYVSIVSQTEDVALNITQQQTTSTNFKKEVEIDDVFIWKSDWTTPDGNLSWTAGDLCLNGADNDLYICTWTTNWEKVSGDIDGWSA